MIRSASETQISLIRVFAVRMKKHWDLSYPLNKENSDLPGLMARLILDFAGRICHFVGFVMRRLKYSHLGSAQGQDKDSLLVKRRNDNHSPGPVIRESMGGKRGN